MVDPARHTGLPERTLGELSETSLGKKYLIQTRTKDALVGSLPRHSWHNMLAVTNCYQIPSVKMPPSFASNLSTATSEK